MTHKTITEALAAAQASMGKALKQSNNPHFRSKYADLGNVMDACMPALNANGIAVIQSVGRDENGMFLRTVLRHAGSDGWLEDGGMPLIVNKNDMQGLGSAITYARRYGLMAMAGIAPEDDDGNAAAKAAPKQEAPKKISAEQFQVINDLIFDTETDEAKFCAYYKVEELHDMDAKQATEAAAMLTKKKTKLAEKGEDNGSAD